METIDVKGAAIPVLGFGLFRMSDAEVKRAVPVTLEAGFLHFDTAQMIYGNEPAFDRALQAVGAFQDSQARTGCREYQHL